MRQGTAKDFLQLFGIVAGGTSLFGYWQGYGVRETLVAAFMLSAFIVGIALDWGAYGSAAKSQIAP